MSVKSYADESRRRWGTDQDGPLSLEQINTGALLRIADASEAMAENHVKLQNDYDHMRRDRDHYRRRTHSLERSNAALRGHITRLKRARNKGEGT
jgi:hypothetical protein